MKPLGITPVLNVANVAQSVQWFGRLGWACNVAYRDGESVSADALAKGERDATFASVCAGECQVFLCEDGQGLRGGKPATLDGDDDFGATWLCLWLHAPADVDAAHALALDRGIRVVWPPTDEPWGARECRLMHPDGHVLRLSAPLSR